MDKIKFKAKRIDNGEWVIGSLLNYTDIKFEWLFICYAVDGRKFQVEVDSETICIGAEINGVFMYSGDYDKDGNCVVWCEKCVGFEFGAIDTTTKEIFIPCHRCEGNFFFQDHIEEFEIIGNIHD